MAMFDKLSKLDNADILNISNSGVFDTRVDFTFKVGDNESPSLSLFGHHLLNCCKEKRSKYQYGYFRILQNFMRIH